jgi:glucosyl-3-phosphoglycerate synthase
MPHIIKYSHTDFSRDEIIRLKADKKIYVVFSTFGEREADLVADKIEVLKTLPAGIIDSFILNHRRAGVEQDRTELTVAARAPETEILISNNFAVPDMAGEKGKGADMRRTLYHINGIFQGDRSAAIVIFLDADVVPEYFGTHFVTGLAGAVLRGAGFAKAGFWRQMGRVKKFVAQPLFSVISHPLLDRLSGFSYPLAGECAGTLEFFNSVSFMQIYGVETSILIDGVLDGHLMADVNLGLYDHEHHSDINIQKMCFGIMRTYMLALKERGLLELKNGTGISDLFRAEYIEQSGGRVVINENLAEIRYRPLKYIL